jgi:clan AA aspartic protease (TIGR02281 family)
MKSLLSWLLIVSLCFNAYLLWQLNQRDKSETLIPKDISQAPAAIEAKNIDATNPHGTLLDNNVSTRKADTPSQAIIEVPPEGITLSFLRSLKQQQAFEALSFYVSSYLREHPQDIDALLLEAEAYFYTQPLNSALVNYYGLRDAMLSDAQLEQINQLIDVNTTRIIQQFSGDGSWDLLATFLEPLIQVDPLNRRYIMALAKAYGMQEQTVLMENVLAALPRDDSRAQRLRDSIYTESPSEAEIDDPQEIVDPNAPQIFEGEVRLIARNGQYYTDVRLSDIDAQLLIDTGASTTAISQEVFDQIRTTNTSYLGTFNVQTAGGAVSSPIYRIAELLIGEERLNNVSVMVLPTENLQNFDGLLGMNVIKRFNVSYDQSAGTMRMYKRKRPMP